jgi:molybdate transport system substrate-binding protein
MTMFKRLGLFLFAALAASAAHAERPVRVFAAASLTNALTEIADQWLQAGHPLPSLAFGGSAALAKQIEAGAPADLFAAADRQWMDYLEQRGKIAPATRVELLGNALVLIAPKDRPLAIELRRDVDIAAAFDGKLCTGEPGVVPVGIYAQQALTALGWWDGLQGRIVGTDDVRTALTFVERGECTLGIVYATDAKITGKVTVVATFPADLHAQIVYPFALMPDARAEARAFLDHLHGADARAVFERHGFVPLLR